MDTTPSDSSNPRVRDEKNKALPAYSTEAILLVKSTALASLVTVWDVTGVAQQIIQRTYRTMEVFICAALIYVVNRKGALNLSTHDKLRCNQE